MLDLTPAARADRDALSNLGSMIRDLHAEMDFLIEADELYARGREKTPDSDAHASGRLRREREIRKQILELSARLKAGEPRAEGAPRLASAAARLRAWLARYVRFRT